MKRSIVRWRPRARMACEAGMTTAEYAVGTFTALTFTSWPEPIGWAMAAYIGLGPMAGGYGLWTLAMSSGGAERLAPIGYATPLLSTVLLLATGSPATATTLAGIALVLVCSIGVLLLDHTRPAGGHDCTPAGTRYRRAGRDRERSARTW